MSGADEQLNRSQTDLLAQVGLGSAIILMACANALYAIYETWVLQTAGMKYRQGNLEGWGSKTICQPHETADRWKQLAQSCAELTIEQKS